MIIFQKAAQNSVLSGFNAIRTAFLQKRLKN
jgi:hypothetical protein